MQSRFGSRPQQPYELTAPLEGEVEEGEIEDPGNQILFPDAGNSGEGDEQEEEEYEMSLGEPVALEEAEEGRMASRFEAPSCQVRRRSKHTKLVIYRFDLGAPTAFVAVGKATPTIV